MIASVMCYFVDEVSLTLFDGRWAAKSFCDNPVHIILMCTHGCWLETLPVSSLAVLSAPLVLPCYYPVWHSFENSTLT
jgi:hypothetical protein